MAEFPSSALPGGVEWLSTLGGARLLRIPAGPGDAPALILRTGGGEEHRIEPGPEARFSRHIGYLVPSGVSWSLGFLVWPDGTRVAVPPPSPPRAEIIDLRSRRPAAPRREIVAASALPPRLWTAPPATGGAAELEREVALARTLRTDLRAARAAREADASALATLAGELDAERSAHAVTRGTVATLAEALAAARTELTLVREAAETAREIGADARAHLTSARRDTALARAEVATLRAELEAERAARVEAGSPFLQRVAELDRDIAGLRDQVRVERRAREQAEAAAAAARPPREQTGRLVADLDAAAAALRAATPSAPPAAPQAARPVVRVAGGRDRRLRHALVELAQEDPVVAGTLLAGLLPAQSAVLREALSYDLTVRGVGTFAVSLAEGEARVHRVARGRSRREAAFHLAADPLALAELLAGQPRKIRRFGRAAKVSGRRKPLRMLQALPASQLSLGSAVRAGARLDPSLVFRALPFAVPSEWTRGHVFTVAQEIVELAPRAWYITARDGVRLTVAEHVAGGPADATVTMNHATFDRLLRGDPVAGGELPVIRGDRDAVMTLKRWTDLARGV